MPSFTPFASAIDLADAIRNQAISSVEMLQLYLARIDRYNPALNAVIYTDLDRALKVAKARDADLANGKRLGPLHGVPTTVKEAFDIAGMPTTWGTTELAQNIPARNSVPVDRLLDAGAVVIGKTNVPRLVADHQTSTQSMAAPTTPGTLSAPRVARREEPLRRSPQA